MTPTATVEVIGSRQTMELTAIVDTGFDGDLCIPIRVAVPLGLELVGEEFVELATASRATNWRSLARRGFSARRTKCKSCLPPVRML